MGYYVRVLGKGNPSIALEELRSVVGKAATIEVEEGEEHDWNYLLVRDAQDRPIIQIEKNPVIEGELGAEELGEFREMIKEEQPASASGWLTKYFDHVAVIYAFQILSAVDNEENWDVVDNLKETIWKKTGGILQADMEGFTNEHGHHIIWEFDDDVKGKYNMAVLNSDGSWSQFVMELGDQKQRESFFKGEVPAGIVSTRVG